MGMNCQTGPASIPIFVNQDRLLISGAVVGERQDFEAELSRTRSAAKTQRLIEGSVCDLEQRRSDERLAKRTRVLYPSVSVQAQHYDAG